MARKPRIHVPGALYHVSLHGNGGEKIFSTDADRKYFEALIAEGVERFGHKVHGYCLMPNQLNLVIQVADTNLSKIMQNLSFRYTRYFNSAHKRDGHLFQGRYKAILVQGEEFLAELVAYVHASPVRASGRAKVDTYKWSGQKAYLGKEKKEWVHRADVYGMLAKTEATGMKRYAALSTKIAAAGQREDLERGNDGAVLGDKAFHKEVRKAPRKKAKPVSLDKLVKHVLKAEGMKEAELSNPSRARDQSLVRQIIGYLAVELESGTLTDVSNRFQRDLTTMSRNLRNFRDRMARDADLAKRVEAYKKALAK